MSASVDIERLLDGWMAEGHVAMPAGVIPDVAERIALQPQRVAWRVAPRLAQPVPGLRLAAAAVAVIAVLLLGLGLLPKFPVGGAPASSESPSLSLSPAGTPSPLPSPRPSPSPGQTSLLPRNSPPPPTPAVPGIPTPRPDEPIHQMLVVDAAYWTRFEDDLGWVVTIRNPDPSLTPGSEISIFLDFYNGPTFVRSTRVRIDSDLVRPGRATASVGVESHVGRITRLEVGVAASDWRVLSNDSNFELENVRTTRLDNGRYETTGRFNSHGNALGAPGLHIVVVYRDAEGQLLGGGEIVTNHCGCGIKSFTLRSTMPLPDNVTTDAFWSWPTVGY